MRKLRSAVTLCMLAFLLLGCFAVLAAETQTEVPLRLRLQVHGEMGKPLFYQGQPISIQVALVDQRFHLKPPAHEKEDQEKEKVERFTVGTKEWPWFNGLALRIERIVKNTKGSTGREPVLEELDWKKQIILPRPGGYVGNEPGYDALIAVFELDLNTSQSLEPGQYIVKVVWDSTNTPADALRVWHGRLEADEEVAMEIVAAKTPEERGKVAYTRAIVYMRHKDYENAITNALETERLFPSYQLYGCYKVAARAYDAKGDLKSALHYYRKYAEAHKDANPQRWPYILRLRERIKSLESQIKQSESSPQQVKPDDSCPPGKEKA